MKTPGWKVLALASMLALPTAGCRQETKTTAAPPEGPGASGKIVITSDAGDRPSVETFEFNEKGQLRYTADNLDSIGLIARDKGLYFFGVVRGQPAVVDLLAAVRKLEAQGWQRAPSDPDIEEVADIEATGRKQTVAGIEGEVHTVTWVLKGAKRTEEVVLTRDPRLAGVIRSLRLDPGSMSDKPKKAVLKEQAIARGYFPLKDSGGAVTVAEFGPVADERFVLGAAPVDDPGVLSEIMISAMMGAITQAVGGTAGAIGQPVEQIPVKSNPFPRPEPVQK